MHSIIPVAALLLGAVAIILGTVSVGACNTARELIDTQVRSTDDRLAFKLPRQIPAPRGWPVAPPGARP
jgi:hypothetical protein